MGVLSDFSAMALSPVLVGSNMSCFFNAARLLNMAVHWDRRRLEPWRYDVNTRTICDRWYFVYMNFGPGFSTRQCDWELLGADSHRDQTGFGYTEGRNSPVCQARIGIGRSRSCLIDRLGLSS